jgi:hypothetical protein
LGEKGRWYSWVGTAVKAFYKKIRPCEPEIQLVQMDHLTNTSAKTERR